MEVRFFEQALDSDLKYAVIAARQSGKWLLCRHRERSTWELPGGHREPGERIQQTAQRELFEETGATEFQLEPVAAYGVYSGGEEPTYGALFFAEIRELGCRPEGSEIGENHAFGTLPENVTYPQIQPRLMEYILQWLEEGNFYDEEAGIFDFLA